MCPRCLLEMAKLNGNETQEHFPEAMPPKPSDIDHLFPELEILDVVGHGGMGHVYKARQKNLGRIVAVKLLSTKLLDDPSFAERFSREARAMAMMNHPNIIAIYDFGCREKYYFLVMEYVDGLNLRQLVQSTHLKPAEAMQLVPQLCDALQYAHDRGVIHRDIKPENVLLSQDGQVKIADFGLAKLTNASKNDVTLTQTRQVMGTLNYMAPEQREKPIEVDHRADIYSLGVVIYELLTGELPLGRFSPPSMKSKVDKRLDELILRALEKEPSQRFQQISELKTGIESLKHASAKPVHYTDEPTDKSQAMKLMQFVLMSVALSCGIGGVLFLVLSGQDSIRVTNTLSVSSESLKRIGFTGLAACGLIFAIYGIYSSIFSPKPAREKARARNTKHGDKTAMAKLFTILGTISGFACAAFFTMGSPIPGVSTFQAGIGAALLAGCLYSIGEVFEKEPEN